MGSSGSSNLERPNRSTFAIAVQRCPSKIPREPRPRGGVCTIIGILAQTPTPPRPRGAKPKLGLCSLPPRAGRGGEAKLARAWSLSPGLGGSNLVKISSALMLGYNAFDVQAESTAQGASHYLPLHYFFTCGVLGTRLTSTSIHVQHGSSLHSRAWPWHSD